MARNLHSILRSMIPTGLRAKYSSTAYLLQRAYELGSLSPTLHRRIKLCVLALWLVTFGARSERDHTIRLRDYGDLVVGDWSDMLTAHEVFYSQQYRLTLGNTPKVIVDIGSHAGYATVYFATIYPDAAIHAFEANPVVFRRGKLNAGNFDRVHMQNLAVTSDGRMLTLYRTKGASWSTSSFSMSDDAFQIPSTTLDEIISQSGDIDLLKIDIEGAEFEVLASSKRLGSVATIVGEAHETSDHRCTDLTDLLPGFRFVMPPQPVSKCEFQATRTAPLA